MALYKSIYLLTYLLTYINVNHTGAGYENKRHNIGRRRAQRVTRKECGNKLNVIDRRAEPMIQDIRP